MQQGNNSAGLYGGVGSTRPADVVGNYTLKKVHFDRDLSELGFRVGLWFLGNSRFGLALDGVRFSTDIPAQSVAVCQEGVCGEQQIGVPASQQHMALTLTPMVRISLLRNRAYPAGRVQPYLAAGPMIVASEWQEAGTEGRTRSLAVTGGAGATFPLGPSFDVFLDCRWSRLEPEYRVVLGNAESTVTNVLTRSRMVAGISLTAGGR